MSMIMGCSNKKNELNYTKFISLLGPKFSFAHDEKKTVASYGENHLLVSKGDIDLVFKGDIWNKKEIMELLVLHGYKPDFKTFLIDLFMEYGMEGFKKLKGPFAIAIMKKDLIYLVVDQMGLNQMFYTEKEGELFFGNDLGNLVRFSGRKQVSKNEVLELVGMGPMHSIGKTVYKDVYRLDGGSYLVYDGEVSVDYYFKYSETELSYNYEETKDIVYDIIKENMEMNEKGESGVLLSGGLDSTVVLSFLPKESKSYSIGYIDNVKSNNPYEVSDDLSYVGIASTYFHSEEKICYANSEELIHLLGESMRLRGYPAMSLIDASLLWLLKQIPLKHLFGGEGSDEVFSGYPWCSQKEGNGPYFPWLRNIELRKKIVASPYKEEIESYIEEEYKKAIKTANLSSHEKEINYLNLKYFLPNLLERQEKMSDGAEKEMVSPFLSYELANLLLNTPKEYIFYQDTVKGLLRDIFMYDLPKEIVERKKSPFPKTNDPKLYYLLYDLLKKCFLDQNSILHQIFDKEEVLSLESLDLPFYGQLMGLNELYAYLIQIHLWGSEFEIEIVDYSE